MSNYTPDEMAALLAGNAVPDDLIVGEMIHEYLARKFAELTAENRVYRDQLDNMQLAADNRVDEMTRIFAGYIMEKCKRKTLIVDPNELQNRFAHDRVVRSVAKGEPVLIRYRLLPAKDGK